ncbi:MAG: stalk domain-containing protein [Bacillota bacterium]|nr:stalk domain-containing protein [Bacillota bacterium]
MNIKPIKVAIAGIACLGIFSVGVFASPIVKQITATLKPDIKVVIDGSLTTFKNSSGTEVYPIIYEGTTYLPLRAIGGVMNKAVDWDGNTQTVYLGERNGNGKPIALMTEKLSGSNDGSKVVDPAALTFKVGDIVKEDKTFSSAIKIKSINSAERECDINLGAQYSTLTTSLYYAGSEAATLEIRNPDSDLVYMTKKVEPNTWVSVEPINIQGASKIQFSAIGGLGDNGTAYFLEASVK